MTRLFMAACVALSLGGCAGRDVLPCTAGDGSPVAVYTLFFGKAIRGRADLTDKEWQAFVDSTIAANLPNGYTVIEAHGGWMSPETGRTSKEATEVLVVALPEMPDGLPAINRVRTAYQIKFQQQLVGMIVQHGCAVF